MRPLALEGKHVVVVGLGKSGLAASELLLKEGAKLSVEESKPLSSMAPLPEWLSQSGAQLSFGRPLLPEPLLLADLIVVSPGVPLSLPAFVEARARGKHIIAEVELAYRLLTQEVPWVGVTGTNGKSTVTALIGELFRRAGRHPFVGGNLGTPLSRAASSSEKLDAFVVELSSFQLEAVEALHLHSAVITNLTPDHLDRYADMGAYASAKARIFSNQNSGDAAIVNLDDAQVAALASRTPARAYGFTQKGRARPPAMQGMATAFEGGFRFDFGEKAEFRLENPALRGAHNLDNAMAAALAAQAQGVRPDAIQEGLNRFPGLPHRLERVRVLGGVEWLNDSKATNVDSVLVAVNALRGKRVWLILGGRGKGAPYEPLCKVSEGTVVGILTIGEDAPNIERVFSSHFPVTPCQTLERAVEEAAGRAKAGDVVLLSPACASYDQFRNFEERGDTFKQLVGQLT